MLGFGSDKETDLPRLIAAKTISFDLEQLSFQVIIDRCPRFYINCLIQTLAGIKKQSQAQINEDTSLDFCNRREFQATAGEVIAFFVEVFDPVINRV